jgi:hypothetical protein
MDDLDTQSIVLTGIGIIVAIVYYAQVLRNQNKTRQMQLFMQFYSRYTDKNFHDEYLRIRSQTWDDLDDYIEKYGVGPNLLDVFLEGIGLLVNRREIDIEFVDDLMSGTVMGYWASHGQLILELRERMGVPQIGEWTEYLFHEIQRVAFEQHPELKN